MAEEFDLTPEKSETTPPPPADAASVPGEEAPQPVRFTPKDWLLIPLSIGLAFLYRAVFGLTSLFESGKLPGLGAAVFVSLFIGVSLLYLGKKAVYSKSSVFILSLTVLITLCCVLYGSTSLRIINLMLLLGLVPLTLLTLSGVGLKSWRQVGIIGETIGFFLSSLFIHWGKPFKALNSLVTIKGDRKKLGYGLFGLALSFPIIALAVALLSSSDAVFKKLFNSIFEALAPETLPDALRDIIVISALSLMAFSLIFALGIPRRKSEDTASPGNLDISPAYFIPTLALLDLIYGLFVAVQFACLFGGAETAAMEGGYAQYARTGFFQLVAVAVINVLAVLTTVCILPKPLSKTVKALCLIMVGFTLVILASSLWRICLYISVYGLTILRVFTLWGIGFITICLGAATYKVIRPEFKFWPVFFAVGMCGYIALNFINVDARIAEHNVDAYLSGRLESVDAYYLSRLSGHALPALKKLRDAEPSYPGIEGHIMRNRNTNRTNSWKDWSLASTE